jgi:pyruvate,water dikinase
MLMQTLQGQHPYLWLQEQRQQELFTSLQTGIETFVAAFQPRPVFYRSLDLRSHECRALHGGEQWEPIETNPMLGLRGVSRYRLYPELFELELAALAAVLERQGGPLNLILPFVRTVEEVQFCHQLITKAGLFSQSQFQLWMMAEVPAVLFSLPAFVEAGIQGIAIGSNDLTQLLLGVDRESSQIGQVWTNQSRQPTYDGRHPAVKAAIAQLAQSAQQLGIGCCLCGELPLTDPDWLNWLVAQDFPAISVAPEWVPGLRRALGH